MDDTKPFVTDIKALRERARKHIEEGAVTSNYGADKETVIKLLNEALATEIVCTLRYKRHYYMAKGPASAAIAAEFLDTPRRKKRTATRSPNVSCNSAANRTSRPTGWPAARMPSTSRATRCST
jgi:hypothetical protein